MPYLHRPGICYKYTIILIYENFIKETESLIFGKYILRLHEKKY